MATWSKVETMKLIEVWGEESIQSQLEGCSRNKHIYEKISKKLEEAGYERTGIQCRDKVKKLRQEYKKIKDKMTKTGEEGKKRLIDSWDYYEPLDAILGNRPATKPPVVIDSAADDIIADEIENDGGEELTISDLEDKQSTSNESVATKMSHIKTESTNKKGKKRQIDVLQDTLNNVVKHVIEAQKESDQMFVRLKEKRLKLEEAQQEREMRMRRDDQEFQLRVVQLLTNNYPAPAFSFGSSHSSQYSP